MKVSFPHPIIIRLDFIMLAEVAGYFVQSGSYERVLDLETGREIIVPGSFQAIEDTNASLYDIASSICCRIEGPYYPNQWWDDGSDCCCRHQV